VLLMFEAVDTEVWRRAQSHCRFDAPPCIHFVPDSRAYSVHLFLKLCDRTLGLGQPAACWPPLRRLRRLRVRLAMGGRVIQTPLYSIFCMDNH
jgi:hypothetical protein